MESRRQSFNVGDKVVVVEMELHGDSVRYAARIPEHNKEYFFNDIESMSFEDAAVTAWSNY